MFEIAKHTLVFVKNPYGNFELKFMSANNAHNCHGNLDKFELLFVNFKNVLKLRKFSITSSIL